MKMENYQKEAVNELTMENYQFLIIYYLLSIINFLKEAINEQKRLYKFT